MKRKLSGILIAAGLGVMTALLGYILGMTAFAGAINCAANGIAWLVALAVLLCAGAVAGLSVLINLLRKKLRGKFGLNAPMFLLCGYLPGAAECAALWIKADMAQKSGRPFAGLGESFTAFSCSIACGLFLLCGLIMFFAEFVKSESQKNVQ